MRSYMSAVWQRMKKTVYFGLNAGGTIPGGLKIQRRAPGLLKEGHSREYGHEKEIYLVSAYAYAASEENASSEKMVTAPTCGSIGSRAGGADI